MYSMLVNLQQKRFDQFIYEDEVNCLNKRSEQILKASNEIKSVFDMKDNTSQMYSSESNSNGITVRIIYRRTWLMNI